MVSSRLPMASYVLGSLVLLSLHRIEGASVVYLEPSSPYKASSSNFASNSTNLYGNQTSNGAVVSNQAIDFLRDAHKELRQLALAATETIQKRLASQREEALNSYHEAIHIAEFDYRDHSRRNLKERHETIGDFFSYIRYSYKEEKDIIYEEEIYGFELLPDPHFFSYFLGMEEMDLSNNVKPLEPCAPYGVTEEMLPAARLEFLDMANVFNGRAPVRQAKLELDFERSISKSIEDANRKHDSIEEGLLFMREKSLEEAKNRFEEREREIERQAEEALASITQSISLSNHLSSPRIPKPSHTGVHPPKTVETSGANNKSEASEPIDSPKRNSEGSVRAMFDISDMS
ncbi:hypothetical protein AAMO2058_001436500 [Amorphochlora amoebiformis]